MKLLIITQKVNKNDPILGFFHKWIEEFSKHYEKVSVICLEKGEFNLPPNVNVYSLGKEISESKIEYILRFYKYIWSLRKEYDVVFVHMNQVYVLLGGLLWKFWNKKIGLWYVHRQKSFSLWAALQLVEVILTSVKESFGYINSKVNYIGHGIDVSKYHQTNIPTTLPKTILYIGRITPIKNIETLIEGIRILNDKFPGEYRGILVGDGITLEDKNYKNRLNKIIEENNLSQFVKFVGPKNASEIPFLLSASWATVNPSPTGGMDKTVLESLASNRPVFVSNQAFGGVLGEYSDVFMFDYSNPVRLALKIEEFNKLSNSEEIVKNLSNKIRKEYDVTTFISKLTILLNG